MDRRESTYASTVLELLDEYWIDLRRPIGERERAAFQAAGFTASFAILSAWPPLGEPHFVQAGRAATERLRAALRARGVRTVDVLAGSPDRNHREPSLVCDICDETAIELALAFGQDAYFWFDGSRMSIRWCDESPATLLPL
ncbi:MAG: DUF3293 domain-containing protein [Planctomycetes bacterium]|nr:DUF3293 domain-containing protein [Planctomycetota bacterium]